MTDEVQESVGEPVAQAQPQAQEAQAVSDKELNFRAIRESNDELKRQNEFLRMQMMQQQEQSKPQSESQPKFRDDDLLTYGEYQKLQMSHAQEKAALKAKIDEIEIRAKHADYNEVIRKYLPDVLQEDPDLAFAIKDNPRMHELAYTLAKASPKYHQEKLAKQNASAMDKIVENASRPQPATSRKTMTTHDEETRLASMSDEDIWKHFNMARARS